MATLTIPDDVYARLERRAATSRMTAEEFALDALTRLVPEEPTPQERQRAFEELTKLIESFRDRYPPGFTVDASRDSMY